MDKENTYISESPIVIPDDIWGLYCDIIDGNIDGYKLINKNYDYDSRLESVLIYLVIKQVSTDRLFKYLVQSNDRGEIFDLKYIGEAIAIDVTVTKYITYEEAIDKNLFSYKIIDKI